MSEILPMSLQGVRRRFGRNAVLRGLDLELQAGEVVALLGANGSGKTTLFSIIMGLLPHDAGQRCFGGAAVSEVELEQRAKIAYVAHAPQIYPLLTARENLQLAADLLATAGRKALDSQQVLEELGLAAAIDRPVSGFSRGMAQRVVLARALAQRAELLILDEPFTALDRAGRELLARCLRRERARGAAILLSSHDLDVVAEVADRALFLEAGVVASEARHEGDRGTFRASLRQLATPLT